MSGLTDARKSRRRAVTLVPLAIASAAITAQVAVMGGPALSPLAAPQQPSAPSYDPIRPTVPQAAIEAPASMSAPASSGQVSAEEAKSATADARAGSIPSAALAAYQRADVVINDADAVCGMPWQLVAAIGRVESNHGQYGGSELNSDGVATPGIFGIALDGSRGTRAIGDTDAGRYDQDKVWDRAVGPMQFIPSTWSQVGVDGDNDGRRDPQDIDDAALASAVYLCAGDDDLSTEAGQRAAVFRYNNSTAYVDLVLAIADGYLAGDWSAGGTAAASSRIDDPTAPRTLAGARKEPVVGQKKVVAAAKPTASASATSRPTSSATPTPTTRPTPSPRPTVKPTPRPPLTPDQKPTTPPKVSVPPNPLKPVTEPLQPVTKPVLDPVLSLSDALNVCSQEFAKIPDPLGLLKPAKAACADRIVGKPLSQAAGLIPNTLRGLLTWLGLVPPK